MFLSFLYDSTLEKYKLPFRPLVMYFYKEGFPVKLPTNIDMPVNQETKPTNSSLNVSFGLNSNNG